METVIEPKKRLSINWKELKQYRELFYYFAWRDIKVRYKQTVIGAAWALIQPFVQLVVFTVIVQILFKQTSTNPKIPYAISLYTGMLFWLFFSSALTRSSSSLVDNQGVITKIYFPRLIPPISATGVALVDFGFAFIIFVGLFLFYHIMPGIGGVLFFIPAVFFTFIAATGLGFFLAALNVKYRDIKVAMPFLIQLGLYVTPVLYSAEKVPPRLHWMLPIMFLNPMAGIITAMRSWTLHSGGSYTGYLFESLGVAILLFVTGLYYFKAKEREFADII